MNILLIAGLPGSGKTTHLNELQQNGWSVFDDFKAGAIDDSPAFNKSCRFVAVVSKLREGKKCAVADIDFCRGTSRTEAENVLLGALPGLEIHWRFFANDEQACGENIRRRGRDSLEADLVKLREYSRIYEIPAGAEGRPVTGGER